MPAGDILTWASALFLLGMCGYVVTTVALLFAARGLEKRLDRIIKLLEQEDE
jgi:hypothetical protein